MNTMQLFNRGNTVKIFLAFLAGIAVFISAAVIANRVQTDFGRVSVSNVTFKNYNGKQIRAKLFRPRQVNSTRPAPGVVFIHGYQNNRESGDAYNIEIARRGFVVLGIDAIGRGNSDVPFDYTDPRFDDTFGARSSMAYLRSLPFVNHSATGIMGHSMGAKFAYQVALADSTIRSVIIIGSAYDEKASDRLPQNMLMLIGELDEFRDFFTKTDDLVTEWMVTPATRNAFGREDAAFNTLYGSFAEGTARKVFMPRISHIQESHCSVCIAEAVTWLKQSLNPTGDMYMDPADQIWKIKEAMTLVAMLGCFFSIMPLGLLLLKTGFFSSLQRTRTFQFAADTRSYLRGVTINGILMWLYLPLIMTLFAIHKFVIRVDTVFPMLLVDAILWWFVWINIFGLILFRRWYRKNRQSAGLSLLDLGISYSDNGFSLDRRRIAKTIVLGLVLFGFMYICEILSEKLLMVDFRFIYPLVSDLTPYRVLMFLLYFPFILFGFLVLCIFVHGQVRRAVRNNWLRTYLHWTRSNIVALLTPLILFLLIQYIPLLSTGFIPFEGPGGVFVVFILELFFIMLTLTIVMFLSTWFYQLTGTIYLSALINALVVTWLFASSQVVAPIP